MKKDKVVTPTNEKKAGANSNPENKFKKDQDGAATTSIASVIDQTKAKTGKGWANEGTTVSYEEER